MSDAQSRLSDAADKAEIGADILIRVAEGDEDTEVETATGPRPTVAKWFKDRYEEFYGWSAGILGGNLDAAARAEAAAVRADFARDAAEDAVQYDYPSVANQTTLMAITGMTTGQRAFVRDTEHVWRYDGAAWGDLGLAPTAGKANISDFQDVGGGLWSYPNYITESFPDDVSGVVNVITVDPAAYDAETNLSGLTTTSGGATITVSSASGSGGAYSTGSDGISMHASAGSSSPVIMRVPVGGYLGLSRAVIVSLAAPGNAINSAGPFISGKFVSGIRYLRASIQSTDGRVLLQETAGSNLGSLTNTTLLFSDHYAAVGDEIGVALIADGDDLYAALYVNRALAGRHLLENPAVWTSGTAAGMWASPLSTAAKFGAWGYAPISVVNKTNYMLTTDDAGALPAAIAEKITEIIGDTSVSADTIAEAPSRKILTRHERSQIRYLSTAGVPQGGRPVAYELHPLTEAYRQACAANSITLSRGRLNRHSYMMDRLDAGGILEKLIGLWLWSPAGEEAWMINHITPGTHDLVRAGSPSYSLVHPIGASAATAADYYDTGISTAQLEHDDVSMGAFPTTAGSASTTAGGDIGASPESSERCSLWSFRSDSRPHAYLGNAVRASASAASAGTWVQGAWHAVNRVDAGDITFSNFGVGCATLSAPSTPFADSGATICLFRPLRSGKPGLNTLAGAFVGRGLTESQMRELCAATQDFIDSSRYGDPFIYDIGVGPDVVRRDVIIEGCSLSSVICAYEAARRGYSVAIVGDWQDDTIGDLGGMPANGLGNIDIAQPSISGGLFREIIRWCNLVFAGRADNSTQAGMNAWPLAYSSCIRQMLDPTRPGVNVGTEEAPEILLPGMDIEVFMTGGISSVSKFGTEIKSISTRDGRTFFGKMFGAGGYDGDFLHFADLPRRIGMSATGTSYENRSGWRPDSVEFVPFSGTTLNIDPYRVSGSPESGLLPTISSPKGLSAGGADPALQGMNYRLTASFNEYNRGPKISAEMPAGYDAAGYELLGRTYAAYLAETGSSVSYTQAFTQYQLPNSALDLNARGGISLNMPNAGELYAAAGADPIARRGVWNAIRSWVLGYFYWVGNSGDARLSASLTSNVPRFYLHGRHHLNPGPHGMLFVPKQAYRREPIFMAENHGFVLDANDLMMPDSVGPRSFKTISMISYAWDSHIKRIIASEGRVARVGVITDESMGGPPGRANGLAPWPLEASLPDVDRCSNLVLLTCPSMTRLAWAPSRMEPAMGQAAECLAAAIDLAIRNDCALQDVDYDALRAAVVDESPYYYEPLLRRAN